ncbi:MAG: 4Fe-4S binding protein, partial [Firmicutes bacterium]|nr:4Fe-4S binding protein [Bacillota bacterium]
FAIKMMNGQPEFDRSKCLLCGYCADACPEFAIRVR